MNTQTVALVGLGRVGTAFLEELLAKMARGVDIAYAVERNDTAGRRAAQAATVTIVTIDQLVAEGNKVDIIFDLTGSTETRRELRDKLHASGNHHTVIAPESVARLLWAVMTPKELPNPHASQDY